MSPMKTMENKINTIAWLHDADELHTYGIECLCNDSEFIKIFRDSVIYKCRFSNCKYFVQGERISESGVSWSFIEFFGESDIDKIFKVIELINEYFKKELYNYKIMMEEPTRELLESLNLF